MEKKYCLQTKYHPSLDRNAILSHTLYIDHLFSSYHLGVALTVKDNWWFLKITARHYWPLYMKVLKGIHRWSLKSTIELVSYSFDCAWKVLPLSRIDGLWKERKLPTNSQTTWKPAPEERNPYPLKMFMHAMEFWGFLIVLLLSLHHEKVVWLESPTTAQMSPR